MKKISLKVVVLFIGITAISCSNIKMAFNEYQMRYYVTDSYVNVHKSNAQANEHNHACNSIVLTY